MQNFKVMQSIFPQESRCYSLFNGECKCLKERGKKKEGKVKLIGHE